MGRIGGLSGSSLKVLVLHQITVDQDAKPVAFPPRRLTPALVQEVQSELDRLFEESVIRKIEEHLLWSSPLVAKKQIIGLHVSFAFSWTLHVSTKLFNDQTSKF